MITVPIRLAVVLFALNVAQAAQFPILETGRTLIFSDGTAGIVHDLSLWSRLAEHEGEEAVVVHSPLRLMEELASEGWRRVVILARYGEAEPVFATSLREFAQLYPDSLVYLFFWEVPPGTKVPGDAVYATRSCFFWNANRTFATFIDGAWLNGPAADTRVYRGQVFPDFSAVSIIEPQPAGLPPAGDTESNANSSGVRGLACECGGKACECCGVCWAHNLNVCNSTQITSVAGCQAAYGPGGSDPNPTELAACIDAANAAHTSCVKNAGTQYKASRAQHQCDEKKKN